MFTLIIHKIQAYIALMLLCGSATVCAQVYKHRAFNTTDGLSSTTIYHAVQDDKGYIWFATDAGATKFDGAHFHSYYKNDGLMDNDVIRLLRGKNGKIGFLSYNGRFSYYENGQIYNPNNTDWLKKAVFKYTLVAGFEDSKGRIWLSTKDGTVYSLSPEGMTNYGKKPANKGRKSSFAHFFYEDNEHKIWIDGCFFIDKERILRDEKRFEFEDGNAFFHHIKQNYMLFLAKEGIIRWENNEQSIYLPRKAMANIGEKQYGYLLEDAEGNLWIPTIGNGVYKYQKDKNGKWLPYFRYLNDTKVSTALQDNEGNIWFCLLGEGLYMLPSNYESATTYNLKTETTSGRVNAVIEDRQHNIWCGMDDANIYIIPSNNQGIKTLPIRFDILKDRAYQNVLHLKEDGNGRVWAMTPSRIVVFTPNGNSWTQTIVPNPDKLSFKAWSFSADGRVALAYSRGIAWLDEKNGQFLIRKEPKIAQQTTYSVFWDSKMRLWVANLDGLQQFDGKICRSWARFHPLFKEKIKSIAELPDKTLVLAAEGYGLLLLKDSTLTKHISVSQDFHDNIFRQLQIRDSTIWCTGNHGLTQLQYKNNTLGHVTTFRTSEGLASDEVIDVFVTKWETMAATAKGLTILVPDDKKNTLPKPNIFILNKKPNSPNYFGKNTLYPNNTSTIDFEAIALREPDEVRYRYRFTPTQAWQYTNHNNNTVSLSQLQAGAYHFEVQAQHLDSVWSNSDTLDFVIRPFWWQTAWFWLLSTAFLLSIVAYFFLRYTKRKQRQQTERLQAEKKMTELEQQALQNMMNPHFVFNVLNSVQYFLNNNDKEAANRYLTQFARMLRTNLEYSTKQSIGLDEEIRYLNLYLSLEKLRCGDTLNYVFEVDEELDTAYIFLPPMLLQPYIENAIWHGIMPNKEAYGENGGLIRIAITEPEPNLLRIYISDDGVGIDTSITAKHSEPSDHHSLALSLTADRLRIMSELTQKVFSVSIQQIDKDGGTAVEMFLSIV